MHVASTTRRLPAGAAALLRLTALASLAFISAAGLSLAKDRCADTAQAVQALHEDDHYQATTLLSLEPVRVHQRPRVPQA